MSSDWQAILPANYTFTTADAGSYTFTLTLKTAGAGRVLKVADIATSNLSGVATTYVSPAAASKLSVANVPSPETSGSTQSFTVTAVDPYSNVATGYVGTVRFSSSDAQAVLPANYTFTFTDARAHTFATVLKTLGTADAHRDRYEDIHDHRHPMEYHRQALPRQHRSHRLSAGFPPASDFRLEQFAAGATDSPGSIPREPPLHKG